ncbi:hypothetical protein [[Kitasatospora] papulosa]|uniref:hypothetical protein n=1 Tax=[Kitasatospora] papulosa TaxID=1464011 RepID=UPI002E295E55|nr:hypothetical protein [[Kitasatospora] papulosa]
MGLFNRKSDRTESPEQRYARQRQELDQMHADYEAMDQAEYDQFNAEMDARDAERNKH